MKRLFPIAFLLILFSALSLSTVFACGGGAPPSIHKLLEDGESVVVGQFVELDDANANGIFRVDLILTGEIEAQYLTVSVNDIRQEIAYNVGRIYPCGGHHVKHISTDGIYILPLTRGMNGEYYSEYHNPFYYSTPEQIRKVYERYRGVSGTPYEELDLQGFIDYFSELVGQEPRLPTPDSPYPRTTPIILTSESGQEYLLPVDSTEIVAISDEDAFLWRREQHYCQPAPCTAFSPNGLDTIYLVGENDPRGDYSSYALNQKHDVEGQRVSIAANSEAFVLWQNSELQVYLLWNPHYGYTQYPEIQRDPRLVNSISVHPSSLNYPAVWSPDGRTLVFSDEQGLWLWDVFSENYPPQLLIPTTTDVPIARYFSPEGRYLAVSDCDTHYNLDLITGQELPDGYVSPNDRIMLAFDTFAETPITLEIAYLAPSRQFEYYSGLEFHQVQWINETDFYAVISGDRYFEYEQGEMIEGGGYEQITNLIEEPFFDIKPFSATWTEDMSWHTEPPFSINDIQPNQFSYEAGSGLIELGRDGYSLTIRQPHPNTYYPQIDLSPYLDEPIVSAEWLPSLFYYEADWEN